MSARFRTVLIGAGNMGSGLAANLVESGDFELVGVADVREESADRVAARFGAVASSDPARLLGELRPDVAVVATTNDAHAPMTLLAVEAGVRAVFCEKPMATTTEDARAMVAACEARGVALVVNHMRRLWPDVRAMRDAMDRGAIGRVERIVASCAGDFLSDGTHLVDSVRFLIHDRPIRRVRAGIQRAAQGADGPTRYGHPVEDGMWAVLEPEFGPRIDLFTGVCQPPHRQYQDYEVFGTEGRLWRPGDHGNPRLLMQDLNGGWRQLAVPGSEFEIGPSHSRYGSWRALASILRGENGPHPLDGARQGLPDMEIVTAVYESARTHRQVDLPHEVVGFPLQRMIDEGQI